MGGQIKEVLLRSVGTTNEGDPLFRERWSQRDDQTIKESMEINIPEVCEEYYGVCSQIDRHNRCRQEELILEEKFEVKEWSMRFNTTLLAICIVDAWKIYKGAMGNRAAVTLMPSTVS